MTHSNDYTFEDLNSAVDRLFDRDLARWEREALSRQLDQDPDALERFRRTTDAIMELRKPVNTPDLTDQILDRLARRGRFVPHRVRRRVTLGRLAAAAALIGGGAGLVLLRQYPQNSTLEPAAQVDSPMTAYALLHDPDLAAKELAHLRVASPPPSNDRLLTMAPSPTLQTPPLQLTLTPVQLWSGASDMSADNSLFEFTGPGQELSLHWPMAIAWSPEPAAWESPLVGFGRVPQPLIRLDPPLSSSSSLLPGFELFPKAQAEEQR